MPLIRRILFCLVFGAAILAPQKSDALTICLLCSCAISTSPITLTGYNPIANQALSGTGTLTVNCELLAALGTVLEPFTVSLSQGQSGNFTTRQLAGPGSNKLNYNLYSDPGMSTIWGDGSGSSQLLNLSAVVALVGVLVPTTPTIYMNIPAGQNVKFGTYTDTISATVTF